MGGLETLRSVMAKLPDLERVLSLVHGSPSRVSLKMLHATINSFRLIWVRATAFTTHTHTHTHTTDHETWTPHRPYHTHTQTHSLRRTTTRHLDRARTPHRSYFAQESLITPLGDTFQCAALRRALSVSDGICPDIAGEVEFWQSALGAHKLHVTSTR